MGSTASREAPVPDTPHPGRFDERELQYLTESFRDLAGRHSKKDSIDAGTFRRAFDLPGLVGERLFAVAQGDHEGVEFSNFVGIWYLSKQMCVSLWFGFINSHPRKFSVQSYVACG